MNQPAGDVTSDDKLWAAISMAISPIGPIIILVMADKKDRPYIKAMNIPALIWGIAIAVLTTLLSFVFIGVCVGLIGFVIQLYWAYQLYQGKPVTIPVITDWAKNQGWA
jgi:uncharacterized membrane protein